jgi:hypothetical protein
MNVLLRIMTGFLSAFALLMLSWIPSRLHLTENVWIIVLCSWFAAWVLLELLCVWRKRNLCPRLLTHLRFAPIATCLFFLITLIAYDQAMILHSKWKIRQYVYGSASPATRLSLELHNDYRGFCGNGASVHFYALYGETAAEGFESEDPAVRARSLRVSIRVFDNQTEGPFPGLLERASQDSDPQVRQVVADFHDMTKLVW